MTEILNSSIENKEDEIGLKDLIQKIQKIFLYLKSKWILLLLSVLLGSLIGFIYAKSQMPTYTASLSFALEDEKSGGGSLTGALGLASSLGIDLGTNAGGAFSGANLMELMKSRTIIEKALLNGIKKFDKTYSLAEYYLEFSGIRVKMAKKPALLNIHFLVDENRINYTLQKDSLLGTIYEKLAGSEGVLTVTQKDKKVSIINVEVKTTDELFSKAIVEAVVKEVSDFYIVSKSKKARTNVSILQKQVDSIRNELNEAISGVAVATDNTYNLNPALNIRRIPSTKRQVDVQANSAILTQLVTNLEMAKVTLLKETPLIQIIDKPILPLKKEKISIIKSILFGGILVGFISTLFLVVLKIYKKIIGQLFIS